MLGAVKSPFGAICGAIAPNYTPASGIPTALCNIAVDPAAVFPVCHHSYNRVAYTIDSLEENNQISNHVPMPAGSNAYKFA